MQLRIAEKIVNIINDIYIIKFLLKKILAVY